MNDYPEGNTGDHVLDERTETFTMPASGYPLMRCGHRAQGKRASDGVPVCAICAPAPGYDEPQSDQETAKAVEGRMMRCSYRKGQNGEVCDARANPRPSNPQAAFFSSRPGEEFDQFYCGCWGWD